MFNKNANIYIGNGTKRITILMLSDPHSDYLAFDKKRRHFSMFNLKGFKQALQEVRDDKTGNTYFIINGDLTEDYNTTTRKRIAFQDGYTTNTDGNYSKEDFSDMANIDKYLKPLFKGIEDKCLGIVLGNHFKIYKNGDTNIHYLCRETGMPLLGLHRGFLKLCVSKLGNKKRTATHTFFISHFSKNSSSEGADANAMMKVADGFSADAYIFAHTHKVKTEHRKIIRLSRNGKVEEVYIHFIRCGNFRLPININCDDYSDTRDYNPLASGYVRYHMKITNNDILKLIPDPQKVLL